MKKNKIPVDSLVIEQCVLGHLLIEPKSIEQVKGIIGANDFFRPAHQIIYEAIVSVNKRGSPIDLLTVTSELRDSGKLESVGGATYFATIIHGMKDPILCNQYAEMLKTRSIERRA